MIMKVLLWALAALLLILFGIMTHDLVNWMISGGIRASLSAAVAYRVTR